MQQIEINRLWKQQAEDRKLVYERATRDELRWTSDNVSRISAAFEKLLRVLGFNMETRPAEIVISKKGGPEPGA
jgi:hypothetical protein